jgi:hypothetical protein
MKGGAVQDQVRAPRLEETGHRGGVLHRQFLAAG